MCIRNLLAALLALVLTLAPARAHDQLVVDAGRGPITVYFPDSYDPGTPLPVIVLLHGYTFSGAAMEAWLNFLSVIDEKEFIYAHPDGTTDAFNAPFWNATNACCNFFGSGVDDSQYLLDLIGQVELALSVDPKRIYMTGIDAGQVAERGRFDVALDARHLAGDEQPSAPAHLEGF